jgi:hypothetical protein
MAKTGQQIENDVYGFLAESSLPSLINGTVYKYSKRPKDSHLEDAVVRFVSGFDNQIQSGTVVIDIYVPDFDPYNDGIFRKDDIRCEQLEAAASAWAESLTADKSDYLFRKTQTVYTEEKADIHQHFVTVKLRYRIPTF